MTRYSRKPRAASQSPGPTSSCGRPSLREPFERELLAVPRAEDNRVAVVLANRVDSPYPGGSVVIPPNGFPLWEINVVAPRVVKLGAVMPKHIDLARLPAEADDPEGRHVRQSAGRDLRPDHRRMTVAVGADILRK